MRFDVLTIFPGLLESPLNESILRRAREAGRMAVHVHDIRAHALDRHRTTDDRPFGGGAGMVMKPEPLSRCLESVRPENPQAPVLLLSPRGRVLDQALARDLSRLPGLILVCGRYEGVDERFCRLHVDQEVSIGDYVLSGGELAALVVIDAVTRLLPGVLGCADSPEEDSFSNGLLEYPQYTRPREFQGLEVPEVLLSGDHGEVRRWRFLASVRETARRRPDLLERRVWSREEAALLRQEGLAHLAGLDRDHGPA